MGGGDLNLKKSWHPNTIKNQERVWRAEQADAAEKRKLAELKQEISAERDREELHRIGQTSGVLPVGGASMQQMAGMGGGGGGGGSAGGGTGSKKLEWMYRGAENLLNREEYLLGRQVDKSFEKQAADEQLQKQQQQQQQPNGDMVGVTRSKNHVEHECIPFSIRQFHGTNVSEEQVDLQRKIAEDPLMAVKQREMETRKKLLENPVKLAEIHRLLRTESSRLAADESAGGGHRRHKSKKSKKSKKAKKETKQETPVATKRPRNASSSSRSDSDDDGGGGGGAGGDLDAQLTHQLRQVEGGGGRGGDIKQLLELKYRQINEELDKYSSARKKSKKSKKAKKKSSKAKKSKKSSRRNGSSDDSDSDSSSSEDEKTAPKPATVRHVNPFARPSDPVRAALAEAAEAQQKQQRPLPPPKRPVSPRRPNVNRIPAPQRRDRSRSDSVGGRHRRRQRSTSRSPPVQKKQSGRNERKRRNRSSSSSSSSSSSAASATPDRRRQHSAKATPPKRRDRDSRRRSSSRTDTRRRSSDRRRDDPNVRRSRRRQRSSSATSAESSNHKSKRHDDRNRRHHSREQPQRRAHRSRSPASKPSPPAVDVADMSRKFATVSSKRPTADAPPPSSTPPPPPTARSASSDDDSSAHDDDERRAAIKAAAARNYGLVTAAGDKIALKQRADEPKPSAADTEARSRAARQATAALPKPAAKKQPLTEEERERRLAEMQANAEWRDDDRRRAVGAYRAAERLEQSEQHDRFDRDFANKAMQQAMATQHSVESRLRANKNNIQRRAAAMDENFARR